MCVCVCARATSERAGATERVRGVCRARVRVSFLRAVVLPYQNLTMPELLKEIDGVKTPPILPVDALCGVIAPRASSRLPATGLSARACGGVREPNVVSISPARRVSDGPTVAPRGGARWLPSWSQ